MQDGWWAEAQRQSNEEEDTLMHAGFVDYLSPWKKLVFYLIPILKNQKRIKEKRDIDLYWIYIFLGKVAYDMKFSVYLYFFERYEASNIVFY